MASIYGYIDGYVSYEDLYDIIKNKIDSGVSITYKDHMNLGKKSLIDYDFISFDNSDTKVMISAMLSLSLKCDVEFKGLFYCYDNVCEIDEDQTELDRSNHVFLEIDYCENRDSAYNLVKEIVSYFGGYVCDCDSEPERINKINEYSSNNFTIIKNLELFKNNLCGVINDYYNNVNNYPQEELNNKTKYDVQREINIYLGKDSQYWNIKKF